ELISKFSVERISKSGAKFDFEKAKWFNHEWIKKIDNEDLMPYIKKDLAKAGVLDVNLDRVNTVLGVVKERLTYISDFWGQASFFFEEPKEYDVDAVKPKWNADKTVFFENMLAEFEKQDDWTASALEPFFKNKVAQSGMKIGELMMPYRIMLVGGKFGPDVFVITELLGKETVIIRVKKALELFK